MSDLHANHPKFPFLNRLDVDSEVQRKLSINLARIYSGDDTVIVTPIAKAHDPVKILSEWDKVFQENISLMNEVLINLENSQRDKSGPRSISKPWSERKSDTRKYFEYTKKVDYSTLDTTPDRVHDKGILRPISLLKASSFLKNNTNSGLPFYTRKGIVKDRTLERFEYLLSRKDPCVLFTRTQENGKTRDVWGYPHVDALNEMTFYRPILDYQKKLHWRTALLGPNQVDRKMTHIITTAMSLGLTLLSVDFSEYDRSMQDHLLMLIGHYYKYLYQPKYSSDIDEINRRKTTIGLLTPDGTYEGPHSMPSGSPFTNEDDSIGQFCVSRKSGVLKMDLFDIQGDDGVYAIHEDDVETLFNTFRQYGFIVNVDKSYRSANYLIYLQNLYHIDYLKGGVIRGIYPIYRALNRILYQERWSNFEEAEILGSDYYSIRTICILENCKNHPLFEKFVKFIVKYDKFGLRPTQKGIKQYVDYVASSQGTEGILINQYGDDLKGIKSFEAFKLIRSLRKA